MTFADKVVIARKELGLSQERLAAKLGVSFSTVNRWEKGRAKPSYLALEKFEELCNENNIIFREEA
ncbi:MAG: helix-turn-helix transcriptional regulator [Clostridia bacterium]|nr:helix-turn-helix transcriptional regulator [Clostridia bacterium]